jgi:hypothetical protein
MLPLAPKVVVSEVDTSVYQLCVTGTAVADRGCRNYVLDPEFSSDGPPFSDRPETD